MKSAVVLCLCLVVAASANPFPLELIEGNGRIANGENAKAGQFPYQVGLSVTLNSNTIAWCGGSLIDKNWILTAAHCVENARFITAFLGSTVRQQGEVIRTVEPMKMFIHPEWDPKYYPFRNDIALLNIDTVPLYSDIQIVKLPPFSTKDSYVNQAVVITGWGLKGDLQYAKLETVPNSVCTSYFSDKIIRPTNICVATSDRKSPCLDDSGGPLVLEGDNVQVGLVSFGSFDACEKGSPVVFTRVSSYLAWIERHSGIMY